MATVDGLTKARMLAIEAASVVSGEIDETGHLILFRYDDTTIDAGYALVAVPDASVTQKGVSELATQAEVLAGTDTERSVTPNSLVGAISEDKLVDGAVTSAKIASGTIVEGDISDGAVTSAKIASGTIAVEDISTSTLGSSSIGITGEVRLWAGSSAPSGWHTCDGTAISRTTYSTLYAIIGTTYGSGDGSTTFNIPNLKGKVPVGFDSGQSEFNSLGETGGSKTHTLTSTEMPSHTHTQDSHTHTLPNHGALTDGGGTVLYFVAGGGDYGFQTNQVASTTATNQNTGGGAAHNNLQPYIAMNYIIKL